MAFPVSKKLGHDSLRIRQIRTHATNPGKKIAMRKTDSQRLSSAHRQTNDGAIFATRFHAVGRFNQWHYVLEQIIRECFDVARHQVRAYLAWIARECVAIR